MHTNPDSDNTADPKPATGGQSTRNQWQPAVSQAYPAMQGYPTRVYGSQPPRARAQTLPVKTVRFQQTRTVPVSNPQGYQQYKPHAPRARTASTQQFQAGRSGKNTSLGGNGVGRSHGAPPQSSGTGTRVSQSVNTKAFSVLRRLFSQLPVPVTVHQQPNNSLVDFSAFFNSPGVHKARQ